MKKHDSTTNKVLDFAPKTVFTVSTRRSNCPKRVIYVGTDINKALEIFHGFKVFQKDYKYLMFCEHGIDHIIYRNTGEGKRPSMKGKHLSSNHVTKRIQIENCPISLWNEFLKAIEGIYYNYDKKLMPSQAILMLMANFNNLDLVDRKAMIDLSASDITKHVFLSGGDNTKQIEKYLKQDSIEDDLL